MLEMRDAEMVLAAIRVLACMSQENKDRVSITRAVLKRGVGGIPKLCSMLVM